MNHLTLEQLAVRVATRYLEARISPQQRRKELREEKNDFTEKNIPPEHLALWRKVKNQFKGTPDQRAERFMEYVEEHPGESERVLQENADKYVSKMLREQDKEYREQRKKEKECEKVQDKYETAWYKEQERATREKYKLNQLKEMADACLKNCPTCNWGDAGKSTYDDEVPFACAASVKRASFFNVGDIILYGKYKNKKGRVVSFGADKHGNPTVEIEPIPKGRKQNKVFGLYKIWHVPADPKVASEVLLVNNVVARFLGDETE